MNLISTVELKARITGIMKSHGKPMSARDIQVKFVGDVVTVNRIACVMRAMVADGYASNVGSKSHQLFVLPEELKIASNGLSEQMLERAEIFKFRPLVSIPKVAPLREIPAWSRQPL
jgi:hypothetical protein